MATERVSTSFQETCKGIDGFILETEGKDGDQSLVCGPKDPNCNDPTFAVQHPDLCGATSFELVIKPGVASMAIGETVQFATFARINGIDNEITQSLSYSSSVPGIVSVNATTGLGTMVASGSAIITVTWHGYIANADVDVRASCGTSDIVIVLDNSKSMGLPFGSIYTTKLDFAQAVAERLVSDTTLDPNSIGVVRTNLVTVAHALSTDSAALTDFISQTPQTQAFTSLGDGLQAAVDMLSTSTANQKAIVLVSDGWQDLPTQDSILQGSTPPPDPTSVATAFKAFGFIACVGVRADGVGLSLLTGIASPGYTLNATSANYAECLDLVSGLRGYFCAGTCGDGLGTTGCLSVPPADVAPDPSPLVDNESDNTSTGHNFTVTAQCSAACPQGDVGDAVVATATYTSTISQADADTHARALACAQANSELNCCGSVPIQIRDNTIANPYPSCVTVSGFSGNIGTISIVVRGLVHSSADDVLIAVQGPTGHAVTLMANCGGRTPLNNVDLTFTDGSSALPSSATVITAGTYAPTANGAYLAFPSPAPTGSPYSLHLNDFVGTDPNGTWKLFVQDDTALDTGSIRSWEVHVDSQVVNDTCDCPDPTTIQGTYYMKTISGLTNFWGTQPSGTCSSLVPVTMITSGTCDLTTSPPTVFDVAHLVPATTSVPLSSPAPDSCVWNSQNYNLALGNITCLGLAGYRFGFAVLTKFNDPTGSIKCGWELVIYMYVNPAVNGVNLVPYWAGRAGPISSVTTPANGSSFGYGITNTAVTVFNLQPCGYVESNSNVISVPLTVFISTTP